MILATRHHDPTPLQDCLALEDIPYPHNTAPRSLLTTLHREFYSLYLIGLYHISTLDSQQESSSPYPNSTTTNTFTTMSFNAIDVQFEATPHNIYKSRTRAEPAHPAYCTPWDLLYSSCYRGTRRTVHSCERKCPRCYERPCMCFLWNGIFESGCPRCEKAPCACLCKILHCTAFAYVSVLRLS